MLISREKLVNSDWVLDEKNKRRRNNKKEKARDYFCATNRSYWEDNCGLLNR